MSALLYCGTCCMLLSAWAIIHLTVLGFIFFFEAPTFFEVTEPHDYDDYDDFIKKTKKNYNSVAINCWIAAAGYVITCVLSCLCMSSAQHKATKQATLLQDDEFVCREPEPEPKKKKSKK